LEKAEMSENSRLIVVAAQPGFDLVEPCRNAQGLVDELLFVPIVAWATEVIWRSCRSQEDYAGSVVYAITIESPRDPLRQVIRTPAGKFHFCEDRVVDNEAAAIAEFNRETA
jgi:hypothetical protein